MAYVLKYCKCLNLRIFTFAVVDTPEEKLKVALYEANKKV